MFALIVRQFVPHTPGIGKNGTPAATRACTRLVACVTVLDGSRASPTAVTQRSCMGKSDPVSGGGAPVQMSGVVPLTLDVVCMTTEIQYLYRSRTSGCAVAALVPVVEVSDPYGPQMPLLSGAAVPSGSGGHA